MRPFPENRRGRNISLSLYEASITLTPKQDRIKSKTKRAKTSIPHDHRSKSLQHNIRKLNAAIYLKYSDQVLFI